MQELSHMDNSIIILVESAADLSDVVYVTYFVFVYVEQEAYELVLRDVHVLLSQGHEGHNE